MQVFTTFFCLLCTLVSLSCSKKDTGTSNTTPAADTVVYTYPLTPLIQEISGIADSRRNPGSLWGEEDSGNPPQLYLISHNGQVQDTVYLKGASNIDWEDIALVNTDLYVADIGDNNGVRPSVAIYKLPEPVAGTDTVSTFETIQVVYPDGAHDAEAILVDSTTKDICIITKRDTQSRIYKVAYPYSLSAMNTAQYIASLPYNGVVSAAMSPAGGGIVVKTYNSLYYYARAASTTIPDALQHAYATLKYSTEPQGEAVTFALDNSGYFTMSEKGLSSGVNLYYYKTK